jgi:hypothetical protein
MGCEQPRLKQVGVVPFGLIDLTIAGSKDPTAVTTISRSFPQRLFPTADINCDPGVMACFSRQVLDTKDASKHAKPIARSPTLSYLRQPRADVFARYFQWLTHPGKPGAFRATKCPVPWIKGLLVLSLHL